VHGALKRFGPTEADFRQNLARTTAELAQEEAGSDTEALQAQLEQRVERMAYNGHISRHEYRLFRSQFAHFDRLQRDYRRGGIDRWEARELHDQLDRIQAQIRHERRENR